MDGKNDGATQAGEDQRAPQEKTTGQQGPEAQEQAQVEPGPEKGYEDLLARRDERIAELEASIAEATRTAESAEALRKQIDQLRSEGEAQRTEFELRLAGARSVKAAQALLADHGGDVAKLRAAEPWLFGDPPGQGGSTGLEPAGATGPRETDLGRWRDIAGLTDDKE